MQVAVMEIEAGTTAPMDNNSRSFGVLVVSLRSALIVFTLIASSVMATIKVSFYEAYAGVNYKYTMEWSAFKAFVALLSLDSIVWIYAMVQLKLCASHMSRTGIFVSSAKTGGSLVTFILDTVLAYALIGAAAGAADAQSLLEESDYWGTDVPGFCRKAQASIVMSFFAFAILATCAALYPARLLRLSK